MLSKDKINRDAPPVNTRNTVKDRTGSGKKLLNKIASIGNNSQVTTEIKRLGSNATDDPVLANYEMASLVESQQSMATSDLDFERNNLAQHASMAPIPEANDEELR